MDKGFALGSKTAKDGFKNEQFVVDIFNNWHHSDIAQQWLLKMDYNISEIEDVNAEKIKGSFKADIQVVINVTIKLQNLQDVQNLQVKLVSNKSGFNQIDKRWVKAYQELWGFPDDIATILKYFTGELKPYKENTKDERRMFIPEMSELEQEKLLKFLNDNKSLIVSDILKGRGKFAAEWMLVIVKPDNDIDFTSVLKPMNYCLNLFGNGEIKISERGSIKIGNITMQRKGGDSGRNTANMLQFKINPLLIMK